MLRLFNSLSKKKEIFRPQNPPQVSFYVCGITAYDDAHIGHARAAVVFDVIRRYLLHLNYTVTYIQNFTDIDDKIIMRAKENKETVKGLADRYVHRYLEDIHALNVLPATQYPKATDYIQDMIALIQMLYDRGIAYESNGDILFSIEKFTDYGKLSKKVLEDLIAGHRIELGLNKKNPLDFVLWKKAKPEEPYWESPWGKGRPGWHIECSAMVFKTLGPCIDIHGGGQDLIFPHHENEIAQSEACFEKPLAKFWMHNGFVTINNEKMSKSLKNFWTLRDVLNSVEGRVIRFFLLKSHYRMPINFSLEGLQEAGKALLRLQNTLMLEYPDYPEVFFEKEFQDLEQRFFAALDDDLNTAEAIGVLFDLNKLIHKSKSGLVVLKKWSKILGIQLLEKKEPVLSDDVMALIKQRQKAKKDKQYEEADRIRQMLLEKFQLILQDTKEGIQVLKPDDQWSIQIKDV